MEKEYPYGILSALAKRAGMSYGNLDIERIDNT